MKYCIGDLVLFGSEENTEKCKIVGIHHDDDRVIIIQRPVHGWMSSEEHILSYGIPLHTPNCWSTSVDAIRPIKSSQERSVIHNMSNLLKKIIKPEYRLVEKYAFTQGGDLDLANEFVQEAILETILEPLTKKLEKHDRRMKKKE